MMSSRAFISFLDGIEEWRLLDYETNIGVEYNKIEAKPTNEKRERDSNPH